MKNWIAKGIASDVNDFDAHVFFRIFKKLKKGRLKSTAKSMMKDSFKT